MTAEPANRTERRTNEHAPDGGDVAVEAAISLRVPRGAMGDLPTGVREVLAGMTGVGTVDVGEIRAVRPASFDIYVDVTARLGIDIETIDPDPDTVRDRLLDGFGIESVEAVVVDVG